MGEMDCERAGAPSERKKVLAVPLMTDKPTLAEGFAPVVVEYPVKIEDVAIEVNVMVAPLPVIDISGPEVANVNAGPV